MRKSNPEMKLTNSFLLLLHVYTAVAATCDTYVVPNVSGGFIQHVKTDFSGVTPGGNLASVLSAAGLSISNYPIGSSPVGHTFTSNNVALGSGSLDLKVSAWSGSGNVQSAELSTNDVFQYASVRTVLKSSGVPGVVEGNFFYLNDNQETDFEILTSTVFNGTPNVPAGIWATNQALTPGNPSTHQTIPFTFDPAGDYHEYRIDWAADATTFYIDGVQKARLTSNVPTQTGHWIWNVWSSGDPNWSNGPPTKDSVTHIKAIEIYNGFTSTRSGNICQV